MAFVEQVQLLRFRNFKNICLDVSQGMNIFIGENGQGKTNFIESIYLLSRGNSFRVGDNKSFICKDGESDSSLLSVRYLKHNLNNKLKLRLDHKTKSFELNNKKVSASQAQRQLTNILFSPESLMAVKGGPEQRRDLIDQTLGFQSKAKSDLVRDYKKILKIRNRVLKDFKNELLNKLDLEETLEATSKIFLNLATELVLQRLLVIDELLPSFKEAMRFISGLKNVDISVVYCISEKSVSTRDRQAIFNELNCQMKRLFEAERAVGLTLVGPHKHDVCFLYEGENARTFCSQGQQRALILAFKAAQIMYYHKFCGDYPIILLDDVFSELDEERRKNLIQFFRGINSQFFLTTTEIFSSELFCDKDLKLFKVACGEIRLT